MKIIISEAPSLRSAIDSIGSLVEEGIFEITSDAIKLRAMDPSQISMISFTMDKDAFEVFEVDERIRIGLDISQLSSILSRGKKGEKAELEVEDNKFVLRFIGKNKKRTFKIPLLDLGTDLSKEPQIQYSHSVKINADAFKESLKDAKLISSHVKLILTPDKLLVDVKGDSGHVSDEFNKDGEEVIEIISPSDEVRATFPLQYLEDIVKASSAQTQLLINIETDKPLKLSYNLNGADVVYYLAPRIEND